VIPSTLIYNLMMLAVDLAALAVLWRQRRARLWWTTVIGVAAAAAVLAVAMGLSHFHVFQLAAFGLFGHGPIVLCGSAWLLRREARKTAVFSAVTAVLLVAVVVDAFLIEPTWLEISKIEIVSSKITKPVRIVVLADLQTDELTAYERAAFRRAIEQKPDLLLLAGDYVQLYGGRRKAFIKRINAMLRELELPADCQAFAVKGNIDPLDWPTIFAGTPIKPVTETGSIDVAGLRLTCLDDYASNNPSLQIDRSDQGRFHVVLGHRPDYAMSRLVDADLMLAGHTHGGQVCLPVIGPILTLSDSPRSWASGMTELSGGRKLIVSRGVGMERGGAPRLRFLCRPELVVIDLKPVGRGLPRRN